MTQDLKQLFSQNICKNQDDIYYYSSLQFQWISFTGWHLDPLSPPFEAQSTINAGQNLLLSKEKDCRRKHTQITHMVYFPIQVI